MSVQGFRLDRLALDRLVAEQRPTDKYGEQVRDRARSNARASAPGGAKYAAAIIAEPGEDAEGTYTDVGFDRHHPGFVLWWAEVGTQNQPATPFLRPALTPGD